MARHALLIGVSRFDDPSLPHLNAPPSDVQALADVLADPARGAFDSVVTSLDDDLLTIRDKLSALLDERRPRDTVLLYYSGHGINTGGNQLFLATGTTRQDRPRARSLPASEIRDMMASSRAGQLIVVLDCCHSGAFIEGAKGEAAPVSAGTFSAGDGAEGEYVLMACNALQVALDGGAQGDAGALGLSRFTQWLVQGLLTGEAAPARPAITLDDLYVYLCRRARDAGSVMTPQRFVARSAGELVIAGNPGARPPELPPDVLAQLADPDWKRRLEAVGTVQAFAREERLRPLVRETVAARLAVERDRDVSEALEGVLAGLRPRPADPPLPAAQPQPPPAASAPAPGVARPVPQGNPVPTAWMPSALPSPPTPSAARAGLVLDRWQTQIVSHLALSVTALSVAGGVLLAQRGKALRLATWTWWMSLVVIVWLPLMGVIANGNTSATPDVVQYARFNLMAFLVASIVGLCSRRQPPSAEGLNEEDRKLVLGVTVVRCLRTNYERRLFRRSCWLVLVLSLVSIGLAGAH